MSWWKIILIVVVSAAVLGTAAYHDLVRQESAEAQCRAAGGRMICHDDSVTTFGSDGQTHFGTIESCRCLRANGTEVVP